VATGASTPTRPERDDPPPIPPLVVRPSARFGQLDDAPPRLTRDQRRRVLWATIGIAAALLLASVLQHGVPADPAAEGAAACAEGSPTCGAHTPS
jgi:hypothetical protein